MGVPWPDGSWRAKMAGKDFMGGLIGILGEICGDYEWPANYIGPVMEAPFRKLALDLEIFRTAENIFIGSDRVPRPSAMFNWFLVS